MPPARASRAITARAITALAAALGVLIVTAGCGLFRDTGPEDTAAAFLAAWSAGDDARAASLTDDPARAGELLAGARKALAPESLTATLGQVRTSADEATAAVDVTWQLGRQRSWKYLGELELRPAPDTEESWRVHWAPTVVHPDLAAGQRLALRTEAPSPAPVVDRSGAPLLAATSVVAVLLDRRATGDLPAVTGALAAALSPFDPRITQASITDGAARTPDGQAYTVAVLRETDYAQVKNAIHHLPGVRFTTSERLLAPNSDFGRQVLTGVRDEAIEQLEGVPGWSVLIVDGSGSTVRTLAEQPPQSGTTVAVGMDRAMQSAAEDAVEPVVQQAMLVAVSVSTGDVLAVAQNPAADVEGPLALTGRYPPGSTFKVATATAAMAEDGVTVDTPVPCPGTTVIGGRVVPNAGRFELGTVPLRTAFARSCNTTFAQLATQLDPAALPAAALRLGLGADYAVPGIVTITGSVPASTEEVLRAENGFGQGQVLASPFGVALAAAVVARGGPVVPQLIRDRPTQVLVPATTPAPAELDQLRTMMRAVVTEGTATALAGLGEVYGKTGTAEFTADGRAHGWFMGYRGDVAFAVLVVDGASSVPAVQVAERFLSAIG
ncbi:cell division protein FtsI/penicillin-binding protein 2 [Pseudonocardia hierapolitana]|uniref:Cell division protein FtsI/penicillin-binding protein 2 n=1 Tax=Pseudonocardia hierapolitana TaxID=1128676 RepID=A0A561SI20_9PSEU|nr:penicillin-binding transpeptidase domain-containing protein [Pseudonocardia hierapolitana]TWF74529.1 cell division protein FtsI/penicillin-binding protein 2 [Pseudonocardia hierapolitana]